MGSRKDILKNLGIPEYPWSSDDDEPTSNPRPPPTVQQRTSGSTRPRFVIPKLGQPTTTTPSAPGNPVRNHVQARDLIFSLLNHTTGLRNVPVPYNPGTSSSTSFYRTDEIPLSYMSRATHTPAPELHERASSGRDQDIQRVLAFKRLTRNINNPRYRSIPRGNARPGSVVPSESNSGSVRLPYYRRVARNPVNNNMPGTSRQNLAEHPQPRPVAERRHRSHSMEVHNSEEEAEEPVPSTSQGGAATPAALAVEPAREQDEPETPPSNNTSGTGVSLEEEIVEIPDVPAPVEIDVIDRSRAVISTSSDPNLASTSRADEVDAPETEQQQNHGVKRKRRESDDDKQVNPFTVKDFNQSLLRLLECPVCLEWMEPPMSQCRRGHLVCSRCRARLASCPVCRTTFSSVRNRAMEGVAEMLRYPCRHGCGREVRLRRRAPHESSCSSRKYLCPAPLCADRQPLPRPQLAAHFHSKHLHLVKMGARHHFGIKVNSEAHDNWLIMALDEFFHMKVDVDIRTWGVIVYVAYIGPKCNAVDYAYEVTIDGQHNSRKMQYKRATHSDLESSSLNVSRQDCFHLTLDQALNFIRFKNRHCDAEKFLEFDVEISKIEPPPSRDDSDS